MQNNQFLTVGDVYNPVDTDEKVENINSSKIRNRIEAMKAKEMYQQQQRQDKWNAVYNDPSKQFNPISGQQGSQQPGQSAPQQPKPLPAPSPTPSAPNQSQATNMSEEDKSAMRGQKKLESISKMVQPLIASAKNDPAKSKMINKYGEMLDKDPDYKAYISKQGFEELGYKHDPESGEGEYTISKNWTKEELESYASKAPNGQVLIPLANHPAKYRIKFNDSGSVKSFELVNNTLGEKNLTREQLVHKALFGSIDEQREAKATLDENDRRNRLNKESVSASGTGLTGNAVDMEAERLLITGKLGNYGYGKQGAAMKASVINKASQMAKDRGVDMASLVGNQAELSGEQSSMKDLSKREQLIGTFVNRIDATSDVVIDLAKKVNNSNSRLANVPINQLKGVLGSGELKSLDLALTSLSNEIAKVESGSLGIAAVSVDQAKIMSKIHDRDLSLNDLKKVIETGKRLGKTSKDSIAKQREELKNKISGKNKQEEPTGDDPLGMR